MWSRVNRGTYERPGLVFALMAGGSCQGVALRLPHDEVEAMMPTLWVREMPNPVYDPKWVTLPDRRKARCAPWPSPSRAAAPTTPARSAPSNTASIFAHSIGRYGSTLDYAQQTLEGLRTHGIEDHALARLLRNSAPNRLILRNRPAPHRCLY